MNENYMFYITHWIPQMVNEAGDSRSEKEILMQDVHDYVHRKNCYGSLTEEEEKCLMAMRFVLLAKYGVHTTDNFEVEGIHGWMPKK